VSRAISIVLGTLAVLCFIAGVVLAGASSVAPALAHGPAHAHAIGWAAILLGIMFFSGTTRALCSGILDMDNPHVHNRRRSAVRFTASEDPGPFATILLLYYAFGIAAILYGVYRLRQ